MRRSGVGLLKFSALRYAARSESECFIAGGGPLRLSTITVYTPVRSEPEVDDPAEPKGQQELDRD